MSVFEYLKILDIILSLFLHKNWTGLVPEPTARSAVPGVSPGRGLLISY